MKVLVKEHDFVTWWRSRTQFQKKCLKDLDYRLYAYWIWKLAHKEV